MRIRVRFSVPIAAMGLLASGAEPAVETSLTGIWEGPLDFHFHNVASAGRPESCDVSG